MLIADYPADNIHLPSHRTSVRIARLISIIGGVIIAFSACALLVGWVLKLDSVALLFGKNICNLPMIIALTGSSILILLYNILKKPLFIFLSFINVAIGLATVLIYFFHSLAFLSLVSAMNIRAGLVFLLVGYSLLISISRLNNRFHYSQSILIIALFLGLFGFLEDLYNIIQTSQFYTLGEDSIVGSLLFFILCQSFLLAKANRGFLGLFTTDTNSSELARFSLIYFAILPPSLGILLLAEEKAGFLNSSGRLALLIVAQMFLSAIITWINAKILYPSEIENYLTKEALRVNNITLELDTKELSSKMKDLEKDKERISEKLDNKQTLLDFVDRFE